MVKVLLYNRTNSVVPSKQFFVKHLKDFLEKLKEKRKVEISLLFVSPSVIRRLNRQWRGKDKVTTVLSFPVSRIFQQIEEQEGIKELGEIIFCPSEIKKKSVREKSNVREIYKKLLAHGLLHLYGYSHNKDKERLEMEKLEKRLLS